jgi:hypothetical protein
MMFEMGGDILRIYVTHCSAKKDNSLKNTGKKVTPDKLYTATPLQRFMNKCKKRKVHWAIPHPTAKDPNAADKTLKLTKKDRQTLIKLLS